MRILSSAVILVVALGVGCAEKSSTRRRRRQRRPPRRRQRRHPRQHHAAVEPRRQRQLRHAPRRPQDARAVQRSASHHRDACRDDETDRHQQCRLGKMVKSNDLMGAATEAQNLSNLFATIERFYTQRNKPDAVKLAQTARTGAADVVAAAKAGDQMKAQMAQGNIAGTCRAVPRHVSRRRRCDWLQVQRGIGHHASVTVIAIQPGGGPLVRRRPSPIRTRLPCRSSTPNLTSISPACRTQSALITWGAFYFKTRSQGEWKLVDDHDLRYVHPPRRESIGARSAPYGPARGERLRP